MKSHAKGCTELKRCLECQDVERYAGMVKGGMEPEEAKSVMDSVRDNRERWIKAKSKPFKSIHGPKFDIVQQVVQSIHYLLISTGLIPSLVLG